MNELIIHRQWWNEHDSFYIMESHGYGMCRLTFYKDENYAEISDLFVQEDQRRQGIATELIKRAIEEFDTYTEKDELRVYVEDKPNPYCTEKSSDTFLDEFYKKMGFKLNRLEAQISEYDKENNNYKWYKVYTINYKDL